MDCRAVHVQVLGFHAGYSDIREHLHTHRRGHGQVSVPGRCVCLDDVCAWTMCVPGRCVYLDDVHARRVYLKNVCF